MTSFHSFHGIENINISLTAFFLEVSRFRTKVKDKINSFTLNIYVRTIIMQWNKKKQEHNIAKHGLDFKDANHVLASPYRLDIEAVRNNEQRTQSFAYVFDYLAVLTVVHKRDEKRIISFRRASKNEREVYHDWLEEYG